MLRRISNVIVLTLITGIVTLSCSSPAPKKPRVFVFTDINIDSGDPDDRQSLIHLLWYADELEVEGIVPDRWEAMGYEACELVVEAYKKDHAEYDLDKKGFPAPGFFRERIAKDSQGAFELFQKAASEQSSPLYVLVWGNMVNFGDAIRMYPELASNIRVITIGTDLMMEEHNPYLPADWEKTGVPCTQYNWNGWGRNQVFNDDRFHSMWWLEINWTYEGMFSGTEPTELFQKLSAYGSMGQHMHQVVKNEPWAQYFRVGDTPTVLYVIDPANDRDDPTKGSWAGRFYKPFPDVRPNYYTDLNGPVEWNYHEPCKTWDNHVAMRDFARSTLEEVRPAMYEALLTKLNSIYKK